MQNPFHLLFQKWQTLDYCLLVSLFAVVVTNVVSYVLNWRALAEAGRHQDQIQGLDQLEKVPSKGLLTIPNIYVTVGLFFTFFGIFLAITNFGSLTDSSKPLTQTDIQTTLSGLGLKFRSSIFGLFCYLVSGIANQVLIRRKNQVQSRCWRAARLSQQAVSSLQATEDRQVQRDILQALERIGQQLENAYRISDQEPGNVQAIVASAKDSLADKLGHTLNDILYNAQAYSDLQRNIQALMNLVSEVTGDLRDATQDFNKHTPELIRGVSAAAQELIRFPQETQATIQAMGNTLSMGITKLDANLGKRIGDTVSAAISANMAQPLKLMEKTIDGSVDDLGERLAGQISSTQAGVQETLERLQGTLASSLDALGATLSGTRVDLSALDRLVQESRETMLASTEVVQGALRSGITESVATLGTGIGESLQSMEAALGGSLQSMEAALGGNLQNIRTSIEGSLYTLQGINTTLLATQQAVGDRLVGQVVAASEQAEDGRQALRAELANAVEAAVKPQMDVLQHTRQLLPQLSERLATIESAMKHVRTAEEVVTKNLQMLRDTSQTFQKSVTDWLKRADRAGDNLHKIPVAFQKSIEQLGESLTATLNQLGAAVDARVDQRTAMAPPSLDMEASEQPALADA